MRGSDIMGPEHELSVEKCSDANLGVSRVVETETQVSTIMEDVREI